MYVQNKSKRTLKHHINTCFLKHLLLCFNTIDIIRSKLSGKASSYKAFYCVLEQKWGFDPIQT